MVAVLEEVNPAAAEARVDLYLVLVGEAAMREGLVLAEQVRDALPGLQLVSNCGGGSMKAQFKRADRSGAHYALVLGDAEVEGGTVILKPLRSDDEQLSVTRDGLTDLLSGRFAAGAETILERSS